MRLAIVAMSALALVAVWAHGYGAGATAGAEKVRKRLQIEVDGLHLSLDARSSSLANCQTQLAIDRGNADAAMSRFAAERKTLNEQYRALEQRLHDSHRGQCRDWAQQPVCSEP